MTKIFKVFAGITRNPTFLIVLVFGLGFGLLWYFKQPTEPVETFVEPVVEVETIDNEAEYLACEEEVRGLFSQEIDRIDQLEAEYENSEDFAFITNNINQEIKKIDEQIAREKELMEQVKARRASGDYSVYPDYLLSIAGLENQKTQKLSMLQDHITNMSNMYMDYREKASEELETEIDRCAVRFPSN